MIHKTASSSPSIKLCQFINNTASKGNGGAIALYESSERLIMSNINSSVVIRCQFINNTASIKGGAIFNNGRNTTLLIYRSAYHNN